MKRIITPGIDLITPLAGSSAWYWGTDETGGDLYAAQMLFQNGGPQRRTRLILMHYPDGTVFEPILTEEGQYLGQPVYQDGRIFLLLADFPREELRISSFDAETRRTALVTTLPLASAGDCRNLELSRSPLMLTRYTDEVFQILWPERREFPKNPRESFLFREGERLYFWAWDKSALDLSAHPEEDCIDTILVRDWNTGETLEEVRGLTYLMPNGEYWALVQTDGNTGCPPGEDSGNSHTVDKDRRSGP